MRRAVVLFSMIGLLFLVGCFKAGPTTQLTPISISLLSSVNPLEPGEATQITASVYDQNKQGVTWNISPLNFGALSQETSTSVMYTAPTNFTATTTVTITATSITNPTVTSSLQVTATPIVVSFFPPSDQTLNQGQQLTIAPTVTNDTNQAVVWMISPPTGAGSIQVSPLFATYIAPSTVSAPTVATVTATSVNSTALAVMHITVFPAGAGANVAAIQVDGGPVPGQVNRNGAFTSVTICNPGSTSTCQTVDGILVDTGSYGLRILQSEIPLLKLPPFTDQYGDTLENCAEQPGGSYLWGPVATADVYIAGEAAASPSGASVGAIPLQVISSSPQIVPNGCSNGSDVNENTPLLLGANGILGVGPEPTDCTLAGVNYCDGSSQPEPRNIYFACPSLGCEITDSPVIVATRQQVTNPITLFSSFLGGNNDSNGMVLQLPAVSGTEASAIGTMTFGIGTESNNSLGSATVFTLDSNDHFTTVFNGQTLTASFIDSGSSALLFPDSLPTCEVNSTLYCPSSTVNLSATNTGATQGQSTVSFSVGNADSQFSTYPDNAVFSDLAGPSPAQTSCSGGSGSCSFIWGLPFFYGRTVFVAIDGKSVSGSSGQPPWWAY